MGLVECKKMDIVSKIQAQWGSEPKGWDTEVILSPGYVLFISFMTAAY